MLMNIAIDGPSAAGKSTIAKIIAKKLGYIHLDTGAMYRCCAYATKLYNVKIDDLKAIEEMMQSIQISFDKDGDICLNNINVSKEIRTNEISMRTSTISQIPFVREKLVAMQREIAKEKGYILDGRDIGTVVLPNAEVKIFLVASIDARAKRRYDEYITKGVDVVYDDIYKDIEQRDYQDTHRKVSPLKKANDAIEVDTSNLTIDEVSNKILSILGTKK